MIYAIITIMRISARLTQLYPSSRRASKAALRQGLVTLDGKIITKDIEISSGVVEYLGTINTPNFNPEDYILAKHRQVIFLYKPPFMHSDRLHPSDNLTVSDIVKSMPDYKSISRLDYETDGIIAAVRDNLKIQTVKKRYLALVSGSFPEILTANWSIDADNKRKVKVINDGNGNITFMKKIMEKNGISLIEAVLQKAARHQIRAFCAYAGYPIVGDKLYGGQEFSRLCLHSESIEINGLCGNCGKFTEKFIAIID